jgi:hypothetical protein
VWLGLELGRKLVPSPQLAFRLYKNMAKSNRVIPKKRRGRPATGKDPLTALRLPPELTRAIEAWAAQQDDEPNRSEAIRRLVELGLTVKQPTALSSKTAARAADLAAKVIDKSIAPGTPPEERETRKRKLMQGPSSLRGDRKDRAK